MLQRKQAQGHKQLEETFSSMQGLQRNSIATYRTPTFGGVNFASARSTSSPTCRDSKTDQLWKDASKLKSNQKTQNVRCDSSFFLLEINTLPSPDKNYNLPRSLELRKGIFSYRHQIQCSPKEWNELTTLRSRGSKVEHNFCKLSIFTASTITLPTHDHTVHNSSKTWSRHMPFMKWKSHQEPADFMKDVYLWLDSVS